jgi:predicted kinase
MVLQEEDEEVAKLTISRGISGSGKSTWARQQPNAIVVSRDDLRELLYPGVDYYNADKDLFNERERVVSAMQDAMVAGGLKAGKHVIVDNTNIEWKYVKSLAKIGYRYGAEVEVKVFEVPLTEAIRRDVWRGENGGRYVGATVITKQYNRFKANKNKQLEPVFAPSPYHGTPGKPKAFLVDIDGTLAHMRDYRGPFDWHNVGLDDVDKIIVGIVGAIWQGTYSVDEPYTVIAMSGRDEVCRKETEDWLRNKAYCYYDELFMRPEGDMRPDNIVKAELFDKYVRDNFDVQFVLDDRDQVVDMWRRMGLTCLQVAEGDF